MARGLIFERRRFSQNSVYAGIEFIWVSLAPTTKGIEPARAKRTRAQRTRAKGRADFVAGLSLRECQTIADIVAGELARRGLRRARMGGRAYCAVEEKIVDDIMTREIDLGEIACQIEEAKMELRCEMSSFEMSSTSRSHRS